MKKIIGVSILAAVFLFLSVPTWSDTPPPKVTIGPVPNGLSISGQKISLGLASGSSIGALSNTDWTTFNSKQSALTLGNLTSPTTGVSVTGGTGAVVGSGASVSIQTASGSQPGLLSSTDWSTFNSKVNSSRSINTTSPITGGGDLSADRTIAIPAATSSANGYLTSTDWSTFNGKQSALTIGNLTDVGTDGITVTSGTGAVIGSGTSLSQHVANASFNGYLSSTDWSTFNSKQAAGNYLTAISGDVVVVGSGSSVATIQANVVTNAKAAQMGAHTHKGNNTGSTANAIDLTQAQLTADLNVFTSSLQGVVPASGGSTANFLRADGTWSAPAGSGSGTVNSVSGVNANGFSFSISNPTTTPAITLSASSTGILKGSVGQMITATPGVDYMSGSNPSFTGTMTGSSIGLTGTIGAANFSGSSSGTNSGDVTLAAVGSSPSANGASLSGQQLTLQPASGTLPGLLTAGAQTIGGAKSFTGNITGTQIGLTGTIGTANFSGSSSGTNTGDQSIATANGFSGSGTSSITLSTTASGVLKGSGGALTPATVGSDYLAATSGDVVVIGSGSTVATIQSNAVTTGKIINSAVTYAKIQNVSANSVLLGAGSAGSGAAPTEITLGTNLSMSGTTLNASGSGGSGLTAISGDVVVITGSSVATLAKIQGTTVTGTTGSGAAVLATSPTLVSPVAISGSSTGALAINGSTFTFDSTNGSFGIGTATPLTNAFFDLVNSTGATKRIETTGYGVGSLTGRRSRFARGSVGTPQAVQSGDNLGFSSAQGYGATGFPATSTSSFNMVAGGTFTDTSMPTYMTWMVTPTGSVTLGEKMRLNSTGNLLLNTTTDNGIDTLQVQGSVAFAGKIKGTASTVSTATFNMPSGVVPTSPTIGDLWSTGATMQVRLGGSVANHSVAMTDYPTNGVGMTGARFVRVAGSNLSTGNNDLYTVPAGKRALFLSGVTYQASGSTITIFPEVKISGTYYRLGTATAVSTTVATILSGAAAGGYIAEAGEILAVNSITANGLNIWYNVVEFDNTVPLRTVKLLGLATGDQTLYTVPVNTTMIPYRTGGGTGGWGDLITIIIATNGATPTITGNICSSGTTPGTGNKVYPSTAMTANTKNNGFGVPSLSAGDFVNVNSSGTDATTMTWMNVYELPMQ